ncbi:MAG: rRNA maturation RNase YbeY [Patescibacteria group bacterium]
MQKLKVLIFVESRYRVNRKRIKAAIDAVLQENNVTTPVEISLAIVGDRKMKQLNKQYRDKDKTTNILEFPLGEGESSRLPNDIVRLGDIVISYPELIRESAEMDMLVDDRVDELVQHGMLHLLGLHHE